MSHHHRLDIRRDRRTEWHELHALQALAGDIEHRQRAMRVDVRIAVAGEMLGARDHAFALHAASERGDVAADIRRILAEAARVDDWIVRIDVDIGDRRQDVIDAERSSLARHHPPFLLRQRWIARGGDGHGRGPEGRVGEAHPHPCLQVRADEKRHARRVLQLVIEQRCLVDIGDEPDEAAHMVVPEVMQELLVRGGRFAHEDASGADGEHLSDFLVERQLFQSGNALLLRRHGCAHRGEED